MKHHFATWSTDRSNLGGWGLVAIAEGEHHSKCTRCDVKVKFGKTGGMKFWVNGKWGKRPPCKDA